MKNVYVCRLKPYIQPFEKNLALAELSKIACSQPRPIQSTINNTMDYEVKTDVPVGRLTTQLSYWEFISNGKAFITTQVLREATVTVVRNGIPLEQLPQLLPFNGKVPLPNRRCLRYGTHGIHEYRGKFFPQLVRSLINMSGVSPKGIVADPMCGSGTTLVETILLNRRAIGLDMNPLSVLMTRVKCNILSIDPKLIVRVYKDVRDKLVDLRPARSANSIEYFTTLPISDQEYLRKWFSEQVIIDLDQIMQIILSAKNKNIQDFLKIVLSNIIRRVSWQKADDLRVRKEVRLDAEIDPVREFLEELGRSVRTVLAFLYQNGSAKIETFEVSEGDAREASIDWRKHTGKVDVVITSPPYATALPYLDTDRLTLYYLGLMSRPTHRKRDLLMIGNREITDKDFKYFHHLFHEKQELLPASVVKLIYKIERANSKSDVGFRRKNLPVLLAKYFLDMRDVFEHIAKLLKSKAPAYVVIGNNHTIAGGQRVEIETSKHLFEIAEAVGLKYQDQIPMEMLISRDIFRKNAVASEVILSFRRGNQ